MPIQQVPVPLNELDEDGSYFVQDRTIICFSLFHCLLHSVEEISMISYDDFNTQFMDFVRQVNGSPSKLIVVCGERYNQEYASSSPS